MNKITLFLAFILVFPTLSAQQDQYLMSSKYSPQELQKILIPQAKWTPFPRIDDREGWARADSKRTESYINSAERYLDYEWPTIPATLSLLIVRTGNRSEYQAIRGQRRSALASLLLGEIAENKGRFIDQIINGVWSICEESWWGYPAHLPKTKEISGLMDVSKPFVELFAAETGALLAWTDYYLGDRFDAVSPQIRKRIYNEVNSRLMEPLMNQDPSSAVIESNRLGVRLDGSVIDRQYHGWMGKTSSGRGPNNWNPWICSNWINFVLLLEKDDVRRANMIRKALKVLDEFINPYPQDGGCDEGPNYWNAAAASVYDNVALLNLASNDAFRYVCDDERFRNMGKFIYRAQISENYFLNFADAGPRISVNASLVYRFGKDIKSQTMMDFGAYYHRPERRSGISVSQFFRNFFELFIQEELNNAPKGLPFLKDVWLPDTEVMASRDREGSTAGFYLAAKGGHNDESHNHNDIGNYVVYYDGLPLLIDVGSGNYTARTFNGDERYDIWFNCSDHHNLPTINGVTQRQGITYRASDINYKSSASTVQFSLDIVGAYPANAGVHSWKRTFILNRGKSVQVKDVTVLENARSVVQHLMTCYPAEVTKPGELTIHYRDKDQNIVYFAVKYDPKQMTAKVEKVALQTEEDQGVRSKWGDNIYRINFEVIAPKAKDTYSFEIKKK